MFTKNLPFSGSMLIYSRVNIQKSSTSHGLFFFTFFFNAFFLRIDYASSMKKKPLSRGGTSRRRERKKKEYQRRERLRRKKSKVREKVGKSRNTVFFQGLVAPEGRQVDSLK